MLDNFIFSLNAVLPIFIVVMIGVALKRFSSLPEGFYSGSEKFVFKVGLPCMLFLDVATSSAQTLSQQIPLVVFCLLATVVICVLLCIIIPVFVKDKARAGATVQGIFRSNVAIMGIPLAMSIFGDACGASIAALVPFVIITFNVLAVLVLTLFSPKEKRKSFGDTLRSIGLGIVKNPLIIGIVLGLPFMFFDIQLPSVAHSVLDGLAGTVTALSLISIGAGFSLSHVRAGAANAVIAALGKTVIVPAATVCAGALLGFRSIDLGLILVVFGSPTAVSSYIMAKNMESDHALAAEILLFSTLFSLFTMFLGVFVLKSLNFI